MKHFCRSLCFILTFLLIFSMIPALNLFAEDVSITYTFANTDVADAEGVIALSGLGGSGYCSIYYANDSAVLEGFEPITVIAETGSTASVTLPRAMAIPQTATSIAVFESEGQTPADCSLSAAAAVYTLPAEKRLSDSYPYFSFASVSDVHMNLDDATYGTTRKWRAALDYFDAWMLDCVIVSGDLTGSGTESEYERYRTAVEASTYDTACIYEAQGNHDSTQVARFLEYTQGEDDVHPFEGSAWFYVMKKGTNGARDNLFIFMAQELSGTSGTPTTDNFSKKQLDWVEDLLQTYAGTETNIFLVEHAMIHNFGSGDRYDGVYVEPMFFSNKYPGNLRFKSLLTTYKEVIMMSGHTHLSLREGVNFSDENGAAARMIHNSSISQPRCYTASGSISYNSEGRTNADYGSEGYQVYVYDNVVQYLGTDLSTTKVIPTASYVLPLYSEDRSAAVSIEISKAPDKTEYQEGEWFDGAGMVVTATYANGSKAPVKGWGCSNVGELSLGDTSVSITYGNCAPVAVAITVKPGPSKNGEGVFEGSGTVDDPFLISTPADFAFLTDLCNACTDSSNPCCSGYFYRQTADIDMTGFEDYDGTHVQGDSRKVYFGGIYDGGGHTITVNIVSPGQTSVFPYITGAILNLKITGSIDSGTATSTTSAQPIRTVQAGAVVANCVFDLVRTGSYGNGITYSNYGTLLNVYATGVGTKAVCRTDSGKCYNVYTDMKNANGEEITHTAATASTDLDAIAAAFNDREGDASVAGVKALGACCTDLGADALGEVTVENGELILSGGKFGVEKPTIAGSGTFDDPYIIDTPDAFMLLTDNMNAATSSSSPYGKGCFFKQTADIDMTGYEGYDGTHVLNDSRKVYFGGIYDGGGHTITVNIDTEGQTAVFPYITGAILNLKIVGSITSPTGSSGSGTAQPIRAVQAGAVVANCVFELTLSASVANGVCYSLYGTLLNVYTTGVGTKAVYTTNTGNCYHVFNYMKNASGTVLTHSKTTSTDDLDVICTAFNDRADDKFTAGVAALATVNEALTAEALLPVHKDGEKVVFGAAPLNGDINKDGTLDISDVKDLLDYLAIADAADLFYDVDGSGTVDISDVTELLDILATLQ